MKTEKGFNELKGQAHGCEWRMKKKTRWKRTEWVLKEEQKLQFIVNIFFFKK